MDEKDEFTPFKQYSAKGPSRRQRFVRWFHNNRLNDFSEWIKGGDRLLSVGAGNAELESKILRERFESIVTLEIERERCGIAYEKDLISIQGSAPPLPFVDDSFDAIVAAGTIEHLPDEHGFLKDAQRCLEPEGKIYLTLPIEVGIGGLVRHLGKNFVHPNRNDSPDGIRRYLDYSISELLKTVPRDKHGTSHRYYNYKYAVKDLKNTFSDVEIRGWPINYSKSLNLILFVKATNK